MSIEEELKDLILSKYKSLREFTIKIDMPYSTLDTILKRGVNKANINNIIRICKELNIDTEELGAGNIIFKEDVDEVHMIAAHHDGDIWTEEELQSIEEFKNFVKSKRKQQ